MNNILNISYDTELQHLIELSGLHDSFIADANKISTVYLSQIKSYERKATATRLALKLWLINYIKHFLEFNFAA